MNINLKQVRESKTVKDLKALGIGLVVVEVSSRGGGVGFSGSDVAKALGIAVWDVPRRFGAGCNYLGGGVRGSIFPSGFNQSITGKKAVILEALSHACVRAYENAEDECGLNDDYEEGETNWDAAATKASRAAGIRSAY
jgi:hypothetical protein